MREDLVVGIDLGTTNSSVGYVRDGQPVLIPVDGSVLLPSVVGLASDGSVLVGATARNQAALYPERTIRSVKRRMGEDVRLPLGDQELRPEEASALILRRLKEVAERALGAEVRRAVITVPAYFSDAQRQATREAGEIAGFQVDRILHEPTAASLCYEEEGEATRTVLVYDLGGGTFDVSIVRSAPGMTEVLASHGDTALGGDDFDALLSDHVRRAFEQAHGISLADDRRALARLGRAVEQAKIRLSEESYARIVEEHLAEKDGVALHLDQEIARRDLEALVEPLLARTCDSVQHALREARVLASELDDVILVGGSSRMPRVAALLADLLGRAPRMDVNPDQAVALGAALQSALLAGDRTGRILVDVTPFTFGTEAVEYDGYGGSGLFFQPIIRRNTPLPARQTEVFATMHPGQEKIDVRIFQGEHRDAKRNQLLGTFWVTGLDPDADAHSPILFELALDLDGILKVSVVERHTGLRKDVEITDAFRRLQGAELEAARLRVDRAFAPGSGAGPAVPRFRAEADHEADPDAGQLLGEYAGQGAGRNPGSGAAARAPGAAPVGAESGPAPASAHGKATHARAHALLERARARLDDLSDVDRDEVEDLCANLEAACAGALSGEGSWDSTAALARELEDVLFYLD